MVEADEDAETGIWCGTTGERGQQGQTDLEEADVGIGSTTSEGRNTMHAILSLEGQGTSMHSEEP